LILCCLNFSEKLQGKVDNGAAAHISFLGTEIGEIMVETKCDHVVDRQVNTEPQTHAAVIFDSFTVLFRVVDELSTAKNARVDLIADEGNVQKVKTSVRI
jgi:hypothetical protein